MLLFPVRKAKSWTGNSSIAIGKYIWISQQNRAGGGSPCDVLQTCPVCSGYRTNLWLLLNWGWYQDISRHPTPSRSETIWWSSVGDRQVDSGPTFKSVSLRKQLETARELNTLEFSGVQNLLPVSNWHSHGQSPGRGQLLWGILIDLTRESENHGGKADPADKAPTEIRQPMANYLKFSWE